MLHAPIPAEMRSRPPLDPTSIGEELGLDVDPGEARLRVTRAEVLWRTAPAFSGIVLLCTVLAVWFLRAIAPASTLIAWSLVLVAGTALMVRGRRAAFAALDQKAIPADWWTSAQAAILAAVWLSVPAALFGHADAAIRAVIAGLTCLMMASGVLLVVLPPAAVAWSGTLGTVLATILVYDGGVAMLPFATLVLSYLVALFTGASHAGRLVREHVGSTTGLKRRCETITSLLREYEDHGAGWLWQTDANNQLRYVSPGLSRMLGVPRQELTGHSLPVLLGGDPRLGSALVARESFSGVEFQLTMGNGPRWISLAGNPIIDGQGQFQGFRGTGSDVTDWRTTQARLTLMASSDVLTGLPNRQRVRELLGRALDDAAGENRACAVMFLDLDGFKPVNDSFGHARGDAVLRTVAQRLTQRVGPLGTVGRMGGDEFAVVIPRAAGRQEAGQLGRQLIDDVSEPYQIDGVEVRIGMSIGCAFGPIDAGTVDELVQRADLALYLAKNEGRGTMRHFDHRMQNRAEERIRLEQDLKHAIERNQLEVHYQPILRAETREVAGFEALLRWRHPERGFISPAVFVPIAEEIGAICSIGEWVLRTACRDAATWPDHVTIAVNVSARQLVQPSLPNVVSEALSAARLSANRLEIEVTESVFLDDSQGALDTLRRVRALGVGIALDDFGTGYSSLGYLNKTIFHKLKIDGSFVRDAGKQSETVAIIRAIVDLANSFRMSIVAEGIEKSEDFIRMRDLGCHLMQGYFFGRPANYEAATKLVGTRWERDRLAV